MPTIRRLATADLTADETRALRQLFAAAWPDPDEAFTDDDWQHSIGGTHILLEDGGLIYTHASVVPRTLWIDEKPVLTGYVEAVATWPELERRGHGSAVMREIDEIIAADYALGALGTGSFAFYERLGWQRWRGPASVRMPDGSTVTTPDDDGYIMVLRTPATPAGLDLDTRISCEWRIGDVW